MQLTIQKATKAHSRFVFETIQLLLDKKFYTYSAFENFFLDMIDNQVNADFWIALLDGQEVGWLVANRFTMPRYLGHGVEIEEVVIASDHQGKGYGKTFLELITFHYQQNKNCRKLIIKSNDVEGSCRLYDRAFEKRTDFVVFQTSLNPLKPL